MHYKLLMAEKKRLSRNLQYYSQLIKIYTYQNILIIIY